MSVEDTSRLLIALAICDWVSTAVIYIASRRLKEAALTERATVSVILSLSATIAAALGATRLGLLTLPPGSAVVLLSAALIVVSVPQFIWVAGLVTGRFR